MDEDEIHRTHDVHQFLQWARRCWTCGACDCHNAELLKIRCSGVYEVKHVSGDAKPDSSAA